MGFGTKGRPEFIPFELPDDELPFLSFLSHTQTIEHNCDKDVNSVDYSKFVNKSCTKSRGLEMYVSLASCKSIPKNSTWWMCVLN